MTGERVTLMDIETIIMISGTALLIAVYVSVTWPFRRGSRKLGPGTPSKRT